LGATPAVAANSLHRETAVATHVRGFAA
jgi:hypothetical protein